MPHQGLTVLRVDRGTKTSQTFQSHRPGWTPPIEAVGIGAFLIVLWARSKIGGITGDLLGAVEQVGEAIVLLAASALYLHG